MKKNIEMINVKPLFLKWIVKKLEEDHENVENREELIHAFHDLYSGLSASLILEMEDSLSPVRTEDLLQCRDLTIMVRSRRVIVRGKDVYLTPKEFDILYFLASNQGQVFTKEQIYQAVWTGEYLLDDSNIMAFIRKLRKKIEPNPDDPEYILTVWGFGYKFNDQL